MSALSIWLGFIFNSIVLNQKLHFNTLIANASVCILVC